MDKINLDAIEMIAPRNTSWLEVEKRLNIQRKFSVWRIFPTLSAAAIFILGISILTLSSIRPDTIQIAFEDLTSDELTWFNDLGETTNLEDFNLDYALLIEE